jgi:hypothetical protein
MKLSLDDRLVVHVAHHRIKTVATGHQSWIALNPRWIPKVSPGRRESDVLVPCPGDLAEIVNRAGPE